MFRLLWAFSALWDICTAFGGVGLLCASVVTHIARNRRPAIATANMSLLGGLNSVGCVADGLLERCPQCQLNKPLVSIVQGRHAPL